MPFVILEQGFEFLEGLVTDSLLLRCQRAGSFRDGVTDAICPAIPRVRLPFQRERTSIRIAPEGPMGFNRLWTYAVKSAVGDLRQGKPPAQRVTRMSSV